MRFLPIFASLKLKVMILCLETATPVCSVALNSACCTLAMRETEGQNAHSEKITNFIKAVMEEVGQVLIRVCASE